jgi:hypothetical protein
MDIQILKNGAPLDGPVVIKGDQFSSQTLTAVHKDGAAMAGRPVTIGTNCVTFVNPVSGALDSLGRFSFLIGPSFGAKGDAELVVRVGNKSSPVIRVRFAD